MQSLMEQDLSNFHLRSSHNQIDILSNSRQLFCHNILYQSNMVPIDFQYTFDGLDHLHHRIHLCSQFEHHLRDNCRKPIDNFLSNSQLLNHSNLSENNNFLTDIRRCRLLTSRRITHQMLILDMFDQSSLRKIHLERPPACYCCSVLWLARRAVVS